jgi:type VI secretion system ImpB/VipA family protein
MPSLAAPVAAPKPESPFRIGILADFTGRENRAAIGSSAELASRSLHPVSRDSLDEVMAKLGVQLTLPVGDDGETIALSFGSLDDFHPDQLHDRVEQIADAYDSDEKSSLMNSVLHHPDFQALESAWRGLDWLLGRAAKGGQVEVVLLDVSLPELAADLMASEDLTASGLYQLLIKKGMRGPRGEPWAVLVGNYIFDLTGQNADVLGRVAKIAGHTAAPFLTTVHPQVLDKAFELSPEAALAWQALRQLPEAALVGLAVPRFLLRLPYGENTQSIDKFSYEELSRPPERSHYLWGNPALGCASLVAQAFHKQGWGCKPGAVLDLENLPIHVYTVDDEEEVTLAEAWLVRPRTEQLVKQGIMPFLCVRGKGAMQLLRFLSLAQPASDLRGRWGQAGMGPVARSSGPAAVKTGIGLVGQTASAPMQASSPPPVAYAESPPAEAAPAPAEVAPAEEAVPAAAEEPAMDDELAALMKQLDVPAAPPPEAAAEPAAPPAEEEMDPDLAALLKELEGGT